MFRSNAPVTATAFHDRQTELAGLLDAFEALRQGAPRWLAIVGPRKVGKTSLLLEASRRSPSGVHVALLDVFERAPLDLDVFRLLAARALDALLAEEAGASFARRLHTPAEFRALLHKTGSLRNASADLHSDLDRLPDEPATPDAVRRWLHLPEELCALLDRKLVLAIDEVQELGSLSRFEPFVAMRAAWQRHERVAYVISGSAESTLRELVTARHSPFFQHFTLFELGPFHPADAIKLLVDAAPPDRPIPKAIAARLVEVIGTHPFYLQMAGEALVTEPPPYDDESLKAMVQALVFSRTGRLALYFENEYARAVGKATTAAATLAAVAELGPTRMTDVAKAIGASTASTARYLERLGDTIVRADDGRYSLADPLFGSWVRWRGPGGTVVPMTIVGDEAEQAVARHLSDLGFDLVYQSRASRGAFDLLALRGHEQLGLQVKRAAPPLRFANADWKRMEADAQRFGWRWAIASVDAAGEVKMLDPAKATRGRERRLAQAAVIENLLRWLDRPSKHRR
ncbi:MAG: ATP-binding protein [Labilithrix sp.]|nr:ATP-binding protein [Labilithrix sp.]MCW5815926.1 ATP-binding protein [Labilithrix sp.]